MPNPIITLQVNPIMEIAMIAAPDPNPQDLLYTQGGGLLFPNLKADLVKGGNNLYHGGNPLIDVQYSVKDCNDTNIVSTPVTTTSGKITKGLFYVDTLNNKYYWDEVYTTPLGVYTCVTSTPNVSNYEVKIDTAPQTQGNQLLVTIKDINIQPKAGDYVLIQKIPNSTVFPNDSYTDDLNSLPVFLNNEVYTFKVTLSLVESGSGDAMLYRLYLDKSIALITSGLYTIVLLNRENTGIQKELFYDTFGQVEVQRKQLLGDPYNNTSNSTLPAGRKNYLNYVTSQYLGVCNLLRNILVTTDTPVMIFDINNEIKDRFNPIKNSTEILLPLNLVQNDIRTGASLDLPNKLVNSSDILFEENGVGNYSGLYFNWDTSFSYRVGWIFYDLRIYVVDDPELATSMMYNSNRNYTLPKASLIPGIGNDIINPGGGVDIIIDGIEAINTNQTVIKTREQHGLQNGTKILITDLYVTDINGNIIPSTANGTKYAKLLTPNDPYRFQVFSDANLTTPVVVNGAFHRNEVGNPAKVKGSLPKYSYFYTYRMIGKHYNSILPYSLNTDFNFSKNGAVDNNSSDAVLLLTLNKIKWLIDNTNTKGFEATDLEIIIGKYQNEDPINPQKVTGFTNIVTIPTTELINSRSLFTSGVQSDFSTINTALKITLQDYNTFVGKIGGAGTYNKVTNPNGNPTYNILNNYKHYVYTDGSAIPSNLVTGYEKWFLGNITYQNQVQQYRSSIQVTIPADKWNDTTNPTYDSTNPFIKDRFISEIGIVVQDPITLTEKPMIYAKIAPAIRKTTDLDLIITMNLDF